jgi:hypothetical protein
MHVHANYSQQLASLGASQPTTQEIAARRSAEVRKKLSLAAGALNEAGDEITGVHARAEEEQQRPKHREPNENEFGSLFSARV